MTHITKKEQQLENLFDKIQIKNEKTSFLIKCINFFKISKNINNIKKNVKEEKTISPIIVKEMTPLQKKFNNFMYINKYELLLKMLESGYEMTPEQSEKVTHYVEDCLNNDIGQLKVEKLYEVEKYLHVGIKLSDNIMKKITLNLFTNKKNDKKIHYDFFVNTKQDLSEVLDKKELTSFFKNGDFSLKNQELDILTNEIRSFIDKNNIPLILLNHIMKPLEFKPNEKSLDNNLSINSYELDSLNELLSSNKVEKILNVLHFDDFVHIMTYCKNVNKDDESILLSDMSIDDEEYYMFDSFDYDDDYDKNVLKISAAKLYKTLYNLFHYYEKNINEVLEDVKQEYSNQYIEKLTHIAIQNTAHKKNIKDLPQCANNLLNDIHVLYKNINNNEQIELKNEMQNLFEKRIPEILEKYLSIDESYRLTLKNSEGQNAEQLMLESLENIKFRFNHTWEQINTEKLTDLSITNRYTKSIK